MAQQIETLIEIILELDRGVYEIRDNEVDFFEDLMRKITPWINGMATSPPYISGPQEEWIWNIWERTTREER